MVARLLEPSGLRSNHQASASPCAAAHYGLVYQIVNPDRACQLRPQETLYAYTTGQTNTRGISAPSGNCQHTEKTSFSATTHLRLSRLPLRVLKWHRCSGLSAASSSFSRSSRPARYSACDLSSRCVCTPQSQGDSRLGVHYVAQQYRTLLTFDSSKCSACPRAGPEAGLDCRAPGLCRPLEDRERCEDASTKLKSNGWLELRISYVSLCRSIVAR